MAQVFLEVGRLTDEFADAVIARVIQAQIHPRLTWTYGINCGFGFAGSATDID
jgi:hypothetical protein